MDNLKKKTRLGAAAAITVLSAGHSMAAILPTDLLVFQQGTSASPASANGPTPLVIDDINPTLTNQTTPVQSFNISTQSAALYTSNEGSDGDLALSNGGTQVTFAGWTAAAGSTVAENTITSRGSGALDALGNFTQAATYTGATGNQTRAAYSPDGTNFYFGDKGGIYVNNATAPLTGSANTRSIKSFGGTTYALQATAGTAVISSLTPNNPSASQTSVAYTGVVNTAGDKNAVDFALVSSNGTTIDTAYYTNNAAIVKYNLIGGAWTAAGTDPITNLSGITAIAQPGGGVNVYFTVDATGTAGVLDEITDPTAIGTLGTPTVSTLYTAPAGDLLRGISAAPVAVPEPATLGLFAIGGTLLGMRRRKV